MGTEESSLLRQGGGGGGGGGGGARGGGIGYGPLATEDKKKMYLTVMKVFKNSNSIIYQQYSL